MAQILSCGLVSFKDFSNYFIDSIANKIYAYSEKSNDYGRLILDKIKIFLFYFFLIRKHGNIQKLDRDNFRNSRSLTRKYVKNICEFFFIKKKNLKIKKKLFFKLSDSISKIKSQFTSRKCREYLCFLLSRSSPRMSPQINLNLIFPVMLDLCNDTQYEIRATACKCLSPVSKSLGSEICMEYVVPEMFKFLCDESMLVRTSCFQSLIDLLDLFQDCEYELVN